MDGNVHAQAHTALPHALPQVTKFVHAQPAVLTTRQRAARFLSVAPGRDATLRLVQYSLRLSLYLRRRSLPKPLLVRLLAVVSSLAALRRLLALQTLFATPSSLLSFPLLGPTAKPQKPAAHAHPSPPLSRLLLLVQSTLELLAVVTDNLYLLSRLRLVLLSPRATSRADKLSDYAALGAALVGLAQVQRARTALYAAGRRARRRTVEAERKLEELEFWEEVKGGGRRKGGEGDDGDEERREERSRLRDRVREERKRLKELRGEVRESRWERVRLVAEGVFARASPADASLSLLPCPPPLTSLARPVYDALDLERSAESVKSWAGLTASLIEFGQAWIHHSRSLSGA
ncbi:hypothetical protein DMC30DRAFT_402843 [Rhodotorula diobovata]|uniref:Uncharacterized protein n=1 Tax=Rhodotorula diobovata TaxID=5288 RepID=A0A5C5FQM6_9BASI|nr:hypothetical protein DMC30DRAFT_402843 [Rhodotorula diobovata]